MATKSLDIKHNIDPTLSTLNDLQRLHHRLKVLNRILGLCLVLIVGGSAIYGLVSSQPNSWLLLSSGLLFVVGLIIWLGTRKFSNRTSQLLATIQDRVNAIETEENINLSHQKAGPQSDHQLEVVKPNQPGTHVFEDQQTLADQIISSVDSIILVSDSQGEIIFASPSVRRILGYSPEEVLGREWFNLTRRDDETRAREETYLASAAQGKSEIISQAYERQVYDKKDEPHWILWQDATGPDQTIIGIGYDISDRKRTEAEIIQRNRELTILQSASFAITSSLDLRYVLDTVVHEMTKLFDLESCTISELNQEEDAVYRIAKYSSSGWWDPNSPITIYHLADYPVRKSILVDQIPEQMTIGQSNIDPAEAAHMENASLKTLLMLPMVFQKQVMGLVELGDTRIKRSFTYQEISLAKLLANQAANAVRNAQLYKQSQQEINERLRAEGALEQERALLAQRVKERTSELSKANAELARASRLKDEFLASMSHELRTPLNAILGSAEILQSAVFGPLTEKQSKYVHNTEESGRHLLTLINDILDLSKIEAGKLDLTIKPVPVKSVCEASLRLVKQMAHKKNLTVFQNLDDSVTTIPADERRLKQILVNLLSNAVKFTPEGGQIGLDVAADTSQQVVHFTIWDTGIGISEKDMKNLFQPFIQIDSRLSRQYAGTGLGLSLVVRMVEMHNGGVAVDSKVGQGSRFTVSFPALEPDIGREAAAEPKTEEPENQHPVPVIVAKGESPLILVAEDNENVVNMLTDYFLNRGYELIVARTGKEAVERAQEEMPDIIVMDVQMPGMDGLEATRLLKADTKMAHIPILVMTALAMPGDRERCLEAGADEYLSKPISLKQLVATIDKQLNHTPQKDIHDG